MTELYLGMSYLNIEKYPDARDALKSSRQNQS